MKKLILLVLVVCFASVVNPVFPSNKKQYSKASEYLEKKGEVYFRFKIQTRSDINKLTHIVSIDKISGNEVYAYANKDEFNKFLQQNIDYEVLTHPGELLQNPKMANSPEKLALEWDAYPTYPAYEQTMEKFQTDYPDLCKIIQIGTSNKGKKILFAKISDNIDQVEPEPRHMYTSTIHGDETAMYVNLLRLIDYLLKNYNSDLYVKRLVNNVEIWICPLENPDGTYKAGDSTVNGAVRFNANNRDLNRHYPSPSMGPHPDGASKYEPECEAFLKLFDTCQFVLSASCHGGTELLCYPYDYRSQLHEYDTWMKYVYRKFADTVHAVNTNILTGMNNGITNGYAWYQVFGSRIDYCTFYRNMREVDFEASNQKLLSPNILPVYWNYYYISLLQYIEQNLFGINGIIVDAQTKKGIKAKVFVNNLDKDSSFTYSKLPHGDYYRPIHAGTYTLEFSCPGYITKTVEGIMVQNDNATVVNVELVQIIKITVSAPNGNETLYSGDTFNIRWATMGSVGDVKIECSIDSGNNWSIIAGNTVNDGSYFWTVPNTPSTKCLIRISEASENFPVDTSNAIFTISQPVIQISSPNGGDVLYEGANHIIIWENKGAIGNVKIEYSIDTGQNWLVIANNITNSGSYSWTVPGTYSSNCLIRISEASDGDPIDLSNNVFTISPPVILLSSPNGGEAWYIGKSYTITWSTKGFVGDVKIEYTKNNGVAWSTIANSTANDGSHPWTIPDEPSDSCKIRISEASDGAPYDESNAVFIIEIEPSITLAFPVGGEVFYIDTVYTIRWSTIGRVVNVKIEYSMNNGTTWSLITSQTEDDGQYDWKVPSIAPGTCILRVSEASDGAPNDVSNHFYLEYAPSVTVTYPNGGEIFYIGMVYKLWWSNKGSVGDIKIDYSTDNGTTWKVVVNRINNTGTYNWKIPDDQSVNCRIRVSDASNDAIVDISDALFSIAPPYIRVSAPNGGEVWYTGYKHTINWKGEGFLGNVNIEYSTDNGSSWKSVAGNAGNVGTYAWTVPNEPSATCRVRVSEATGANPVDESDQAFAIQYGTGITTITEPDAYAACFQILPNPADIGLDRSVSFILTAPVDVHTAELTVFDALGNSVYKTTTIQKQRGASGYVLGVWDLKNRLGKPVESGAYLVVVTIEDKQGKKNVIKRMVGVKETK